MRGDAGVTEQFISLPDVTRPMGRAAHGRKEQTSHAWLDHELDMLNNMSRTLPPIFLLVSAFLVKVADMWPDPLRHSQSRGLSVRLQYLPRVNCLRTSREIGSRGTHVCLHQQPAGGSAQPSKMAGDLLHRY